MNHVLAPFPPEDAAKVSEAIRYLVPAIECIVTEDVDKAMNRYNPKKEKKRKSKEHVGTAAEPSQAEEVSR